MELRHRDLFTFVFAGAGLFWLGLLLWLGMVDFLTRT
jgi:cytochrome c oxidase subunit 4